MTMRFSCLFAMSAALCATVALTGSAEAAKRAKDTLVIVGCSRFLPPFCTSVGYRGTTYIMHSAVPPIPPNTGVAVVGKKTGDVGICFGTQVQVISWKKTRQRCTRP